MPRYGREADATSSVIESIDRPRSNFTLIDALFPTAPSIGPIRRVFSQARSHNAKTLVVDQLDPRSAADLLEEAEDLQTCLGAPPTSRILRLSFFTQAFGAAQDIESLKDDCFIGYAIIKEDRVSGGYSKSRIYESVIPAGGRENSFIRGAQEWPCRVGQRVFRAGGYLYAQQNGATNSCAHVACRTVAARFHPDGDMTYREMNTLLGIDHIQTRADSGLRHREKIT